MKQELRELVWLRAQAQCEYCQMPQQFVDLSHEVDHIIGEQHRGPTASENLALACYSCNKSKGPNISSKDPETDKTVDLFNPRTTRGRIIFAGRWPFLSAQLRSAELLLSC